MDSGLTWATWMRVMLHQLDVTRKIKVQNLTWIFSFPNSFDKLCDRALRPNFPAANALVMVFPLKLAVAPVKIKAPLFPVGS